MKTVWTNRQNPHTHPFSPTTHTPKRKLLTNGRGSQNHLFRFNSPGPTVLICGVLRCLLSYEGRALYGEDVQRHMVGLTI